MTDKKSRSCLRSIARKPGNLLRPVDPCGCFEAGMETLQVEQVLGAAMEQRVVEIDMIVPDPKPDIEQVVDVYVKDVCIKSIDVIPDKVIVRGNLEVKVMYIADLTDQPVHAFEQKHIRWTRDIEIPGAAKDMNATADVTIEFVDYDFHRHHDRRLVHITIVLKVWARVTATTEMDAYVVGPVDDPNSYESTTSYSTYSSSSGATDGTVSAAQTGGGGIEGFGEENAFVTGPGLTSEGEYTTSSGPLTPTAGTPPGVSGTVTVTGNNVNIRTGPGTNFPVVTKVTRGTTMTVKDSAFGWYKVVLSDGNTTGWIASWLVDTSGTIPSGTKG